MICPKCNAEVAGRSSYCPSCGCFLGVTNCPACGAEVTPGAAFCPSCGASLPKTPQQAQEAQQTAQTQPQPQPAQQAAQPQQQPTIVINNSNANTQTIHPMSGVDAMTSPKNRWVALALCFFFGFLGVHRFYVGKIGTGILYLLTLGVGGIGWVIDFFTILFGGFRDKYGFWLRR